MQQVHRLSLPILSCANFAKHPNQPQAQLQAWPHLQTCLYMWLCMQLWLWAGCCGCECRTSGLACATCVSSHTNKTGPIPAHSKQDHLSNGQARWRCLRPTSAAVAATMTVAVAISVAAAMSIPLSHPASFGTSLNALVSAAVANFSMMALPR